MIPDCQLLSLGVALLFLLLLLWFLKFRKTATLVLFYHFATVHLIFYLTEHIFLTQPSKLLAQKPCLNILIVNFWHASFQNFSKNFSLFWSHHRKVLSMQRIKSMISRKTTKVYLSLLSIQISFPNTSVSTKNSPTLNTHSMEVWYYSKHWLTMLATNFCTSSSRLTYGMSN